jgi:uncharacterized protein YbjQ (UPF0145 family)
LRYKVRIVTKNYIDDYISRAINILGGRLKVYEKMIEDVLNQFITEIYKEYPSIKDLHIDVDEFTNGALIILVYGDA